MLTRPARDGQADEVPAARAPGRVTIVGDHTDYNAGLSLPMAVDLATEVAFTPRPGSVVVRIDSDQLPGHHVEIALEDTASAPPDALLAANLLRLHPPASGGSVTVTSTVPVGAGLSSSASFSVAFLLALLEAGRPDPDPLALARDCQEAERAAGAGVGLLDPLAIATARAGRAVLIDFAALETRHVALPEEAGFVVVHSEAPRVLADSPYATRRGECERAARILGRPLGRCTVGDVRKLPDAVLRRRARHVVTECARVREAERILGSAAPSALADLGELMTESHRSLAGDYLSSVPAVEELVERLLTQPGVLGARMSGGGFGGCVLALCEPGSPALDPETHRPRRAWRVRPSAGASRLVTSR